MSKRRGPGGGAHHPWKPMQRMPREAEEIQIRQSLARAEANGVKYSGHDQVWLNDKYQAFVTMWMIDGQPTQEVQEISFKRHDKQWPNDWRDAMRIKNEIAGAEVEAVELYPAQSRVVDTANQRFLWCWPPGVPVTWDGEHLIGFPEGFRTDPGDEGPHTGVQQRGFDPSDPPRDSYEEQVERLTRES